MVIVHSHHAICEECNNCALCLKCTCEGTELLNKALSKLKVKEGKVTPAKETKCDCGVSYRGGAKARHERSFGHQIWELSGKMDGMDVEDLLEIVRATKDHYAGKKRNVKGLTNDDALDILKRNEYNTMAVMKEAVTDEVLQSLRKKKKVVEEVLASDEEDSDGSVERELVFSPKANNTKVECDEEAGLL